MVAAVTKRGLSSRTGTTKPENLNRAADLLGQEIRFVYSAEFEKLAQDEAPLLAAERTLLDLQKQAVLERTSASHQSDQDLQDLPGIRCWSTGDPLLSFEQEQILFRALNLARFQVNQLRARLSRRRPALKQLQSIDKKLDLAARVQSQLVRSNLRLVTSIARKFASSNGDVDEFSSDGCTILLGAIDRFDYSRHLRFSTYATHSIQRHFFRAWKVRQRRKERFPNASSDLLGEIPQVTPEEPLCSDPENIVLGLLSRAESVLDLREQQILLNRYGLGVAKQPRTLREIAVDLGISKERVRQLQLKALNKLKQLLEPEILSLCSVRPNTDMEVSSGMLTPHHA
jgi:RNA polymerase primary sigma factor